MYGTYIIHGHNKHVFIYELRHDNYQLTKRAHKKSSLPVVTHFITLEFFSFLHLFFVGGIFKND